MVIKAEEIIVVNKSPIEDATMKSVIDYENLTVSLIDILKETLEPFLGKFNEIKIRKDLLRSISVRDLISSIGGNNNPAFIRISNLSNKSYIAKFVISIQKQESTKTISKNWIMRLFSKIRHIFWND